MPLDERECLNILGALQGMIESITDPTLGQMLDDARSIEGSPSAQLLTFVELFDGHLMRMGPTLVDQSLERINKQPHDGEDFQSAILLDEEIGLDFVRQVPVRELGWGIDPPPILVELVRTFRKDLSIDLRIEPPNSGGPRMGFE